MEMQLKYSDVFTPETNYENYIEDKLEHDLVIPDYLSSAQKIIQCEAKTVILDKSVSEDKITLEGLCIWKIMYVSEEDPLIHTISCEKNFIEHFSMSGCSGTLRYKVKTKNVICKLQSSQRASCKATVCIAVQLIDRNSQTVVTGVSDEAVQLRQSHADAMIPVSESECEFKAAGEIMLKHRREVEVYKADAIIQIKEKRCLDGKVLIKGICKNQVVLISKEDRFAECVETETTFNQVFEVSGVSENCVAAVTVEVIECDTIINEEDEQRLLLVSTTALARISAFKPETLGFAIDAYHPEVELKSELTHVPYYTKILSAEIPVRCSQNVPMSANGIDVLYSEASGEVEKITVEDELMIIEGKISVTFLSLLEQEVVRTTYTLPYQTTRKSEGPFTRMKCEAQIYVEELGYLILSDSEIEINCECKIALTAYLINECTAVSQLAVTDQPVEQQLTVPLVLYYADAGEELWEIGKKYRVPIRKLMENNRLDQEKIEESRLIFVSKR